MWIPYPLISLVSRMPLTLQGQCPLTFHTRTFETFSLSFSKENEVIDVFESVKELTVAPSVNHLYAFFYTPNPPYPTNTGWSLYSPREEFGRMGVGTRTKAWRFTDINKDYSFCPTYPSRLIVPTKISDTTLQYASKYRSKGRIPALTYLHWANYGSITRSSQPMVGITQNRSVQDEKLIEAIFHSHYSPESRSPSAAVYGATSTNLIIDARPTTNAMANTAKGAGTENMDHYKEGKKAYMGIDHIHAMRESLAKVVEAIREADSISASISGNLPGESQNLAILDRQALRRSGWLRHISAILEGTLLITRNVHVNSSHVLIHCSDGWDRTSQLSALAQLCLDPFYRTMRGFEILIEKDWLSFGHKFMDRCGHLSSEKFFVSVQEPNSGGGGGADAAQAFLASVQNRFASQSHIKETSPVFHQFLESVRQIQRQFPERFEFNQRFLQQLYYHLYSCQYGTFLFNNERERRNGEGGLIPLEKTISVWDYMNSPPEVEKNTNPSYDSSLDDPASREPRADMGVLFPNPKNVRFWHELYGRNDEEMNGRIITSQVKDGPEFIPAIENADDDPVTTQTVLDIPLPPSPVNSPPATLSSGRSAKPTLSPGGLSSGLRSIWSSLPDVSQSINEEENQLSAPLSSSVSLQPPTPTARPSSPGAYFTQQPPARPRAVAKPADFFGNSGVRSMWGKFSSNASAAFSVVQEAYDGVAKELKVGPLTNGDSEGALSGTHAELQHRDTLGDWGEEPSTSRGISHTYSIGTSYNPWDSVKPQRSISTLPADNPWRTTPTSSMIQGSSPSNCFESSPLPLDPSLALPPSRPMPAHLSPNYSIGTKDSVSKDDLTRSSGERQESGTIQETGALDSRLDPLGVGLL
ncbi:hypothetical protein SERLA73DRAFT_95032 [Serpula lacrymans var. lacrymans S7.3]|uniref:Myotubularin phosphatase domain-containing protein n=2 Tax=Serpula lacrymans var. lacrymans TaxID=341189 RepID=F8Q7J5_SERL3|nr:uncharacterized protein SERLADRAFT_357783 [Serpula lacrymans var. lacrymans S7.9]EGN95533.1 hypothetical protein SERLA73DRAFT_95032 [Serpula lacrymans var. lacrymans S7.3]EGO21060.1 hypothetical protein SERLADRAFT_357783 [Serpula lacrymans var. lacrymans S7.9]